jgi:hypothetical protein
MGLGETGDSPPPVEPPASLPDPDESPTIAQPGSVADQRTTVRLPDRDDLGATQESAGLDDDEPPPPAAPAQPVPAPRRNRWWLAVLAVVLIGSGVLVARYVLPKSAPSRGAAPPGPAATGTLHPTPAPSGEIIPPTGGNPVVTVPARPADALSSWAAQVAPVAQIPLVALQAYGYAQLSLEGTAPQCHLSWTTLAGIAEVESDHGQRGGAVLSPTGRSIPPILGPPLDGTGGRALVNDTDAGAFDGDPKWDHAMGPLGILPSAWKVYAIDADADGILDPYDVDDASLAVGRLLCAGGDNMSGLDGWTKAVGRQHTGSAYAQSVFNAADSYGQRTRNVG